MKNIETAWKSFRQGAVQHPVSDKQLRDMEDIFYCGSLAVFSIMTNSLLDNSEHAEETYNELKIELSKFQKKMNVNHYNLH